MPAYPLTTCRDCRIPIPCRKCAAIDRAYCRKIEKHLSAGNQREAAEASGLPSNAGETPGGYVGTFGPSNACPGGTQKEAHHADR